MFGGNIVIWKDNNVSKIIPGHEAAVSCIFRRKDHKGYITSGKDGKIIYWNETFEKRENTFEEPEVVEDLDSTNI